MPGAACTGEALGCSLRACWWVFSWPPLSFPAGLSSERLDPPQSTLAPSWPLLASSSPGGSSYPHTQGCLFSCLRGPSRLSPSSTLPTPHQSGWKLPFLGLRSLL